MSTAFTCGADTIYWTYVGGAATVDISIMSYIGPQTDIVNGKRDTINQLLGSGLDAQAQNWTWPSVNVTAGSYRLIAAVSGLSKSSESNVFPVLNGTDVSCLAATSSSSIPSSTSSSSIPTSQSMSMTTSSSASQSPTSSADFASSTSHTGAIVGGVIGGVVIIAALVAAYVFFGLCSRRPSRSRRSGSAGHVGKWGGLSSRDSGMNEAGAPTSGKSASALAHKKRMARTESTGAMLSLSAGMARGHDSMDVRATSDEDIHTLADVEDDKAMALALGFEYVETVPPLAANVDRRRSSASTSGVILPSVPEPMPSVGAIGRHRAHSSSQSHRAMALSRLDVVQSYCHHSPGAPTELNPYSPYTPTPSFPPSPATPLSPASPPFPAVGVSRTPSGGGNNPRRGARKPVPALNPNDVDAPRTAQPSPVSTSPSPIPLSKGHSSTSSSGGMSPSPLYGMNESRTSGLTMDTVTATVTSHTHLSASPSTGMGIQKQRSREDLEAAGLELPNLNHKSSFGDRPVHYLIPDMPPPRRA